ncbi:PfkB family carbohydrate kinase [Streptomyces bambusae]|uniref:PfkB family carbohydrate kinase n=1 Tax=Streptomyces bambusae TaxID=1550616 RepID=UPI001CFF392A|nr:PfkB family carbohydrate kinase [Streptomyces bambusae]MCB5165435.1 PfkB family carbohydrate kinase [Streptomyces bambusae]
MNGTGGEPYDVLVMGEVLVEVHADSPLHEVRDGGAARLSFSGDALNAAAAAAAAGARTGLLAVVGDDELSGPLLARAGELGIDVSAVCTAPRPNGAYLLASDAAGDREFVYWRTGSAGSTLAPEHVEEWRPLLAGCGALVTSGVTGALSASGRAAVPAAARVVHEAGGHVSYDVNYRARLGDRAAAAALLAELAPLAGLVKLSCPGDAGALLGTVDPVVAAARVRALGAPVVAVTSGAGRFFLDRGEGAVGLEVPVNPAVVDATGAGDCFTGTVTARLALGDELGLAVAHGLSAASLSVSGRGGTGCVPAFSETAARTAARVGGRVAGRGAG